MTQKLLSCSIKPPLTSTTASGRLWNLLQLFWPVSLFELVNVAIIFAFSSSSVLQGVLLVSHFALYVIIRGLQSGGLGDYMSGVTWPHELAWQPCEGLPGEIFSHSRDPRLWASLTLRDRCLDLTNEFGRSFLIVTSRVSFPSCRTFVLTTKLTKLSPNSPHCPQIDTRTLWNCTYWEISISINKYIYTVCVRRDAIRPSTSLDTMTCPNSWRGTNCVMALPPSRTVFS